jgi:hypothetical protein
MRDKKRVVQPTARSHNEFVKPLAPPDLWEQLDKLVPNRVASPPENSFTVEEFSKRKGLSDSHARKVVNDLCRKGHVCRVKFGGKFYYTVANANL